MDLAKKGEYFLKYVLIRPNRAINLALVKLSKLLRFPRVLGMPLTLMIEPTNFCNLRCPLCPTGTGLLGRKKDSMSFEQFKYVLDELGPYIIHLRLWNWGEPLLNKDIYKMISYAKKYKIFVNTSTNSYFLDKEAAKRLVSSGLDEIIVSLDGASEKTYNKYRKSGNFAKVIEAMKTLVEEKKRLGSKTPYIKLQFIIMRHNEHEIEKVKKLAKDIGVDNLFFKTVGTMDSAVYESVEKYLPINKRFRRYDIEQGKIKTRDMRNSCDYLWEETTINVDGSVVPCCRDAHSSYIFGNVFKQPFKDIWNNEKYTAFRKQVLQNKKIIGLCKQCPGSKEEFKIEEMLIRLKS